MSVFPKRIVVGNRAVVFRIIGELADGGCRFFKMVSGDMIFGLPRQGVAGVFHFPHLSVLVSDVSMCDFTEIIPGRHGESASPAQNLYNFSTLPLTVLITCAIIQNEMIVILQIEQKEAQEVSL